MSDDVTTRIENLIDALMSKGMGNQDEILRTIQLLPEERRINRLMALFKEYVSGLNGGIGSAKKIIELLPENSRHNLYLQLIEHSIKIGRNDAVPCFAAQLREPQRTEELIKAFDRSMMVNDLKIAQESAQLLNSGSDKTL